MNLTIKDITNKRILLNTGDELIFKQIISKREIKQIKDNTMSVGTLYDLIKEYRNSNE